MRTTSIKALKRGDLFTVKMKPESNKSSVLCGDILRVISKASPYIFVEVYDFKGKIWNKMPWDVNINDYDLIRLKQEVLTSPSEDLTTANSNLQ